MKPFTYAFALMACTGIAFAQTPVTTNGGGQRQNTALAEKPKQKQRPQQKVIVNNRPGFFSSGGSIAAGVNGSDDCSTAPAVTGSGDFAFDSTGATTGTEGQHNGRQYNDIWWAFTAEFDGVASFSTCNDSAATAGSATYDTTIGLYSIGNACPGAAEAPGDYNDDNTAICSGYSSHLEASVSAGSTYMVQLGGWSAGDSGTGVMSISNPNPNPNGSDDCASAPVLTGAADCPFDSTGATTGTEGQHNGRQYNDIWWAFTAPADGTASFSTCNDSGATAGSASYDTTIGVYSIGNACPGAAEAPGAYNDDNTAICSGYSSDLVGVAVTSGSTYMVQLGGWSAGDSGTGVMSIGFSSAPPPAEDDCGSALAIAGQGSFPYDNTMATTGIEGQNDPLCYQFGSSAVPNDHWYEWTPDANGTAVVTLCGTAGHDSKLAAWSSPCGVGILACNDDTCGLASEVSFACVAGVPVTLQLGSYPAGTPSSGSGSFAISILAGPPANDDCGSPDAIAGQGSFAFDTALATTGAEGQNEATCYQFGSSAVTLDIWVEWTPDVTGNATVDTCGSGFDTKLAAWSGACGVGNLGCNDDTCGLQSQVSFACTAGVPVTLQVGSYPGGGGSTGTGNLNIAIATSPHPYDECATTTGVLSDGANLVDTTGASYGSDPASGSNASSCYTASSDVWYSYTAASNGLVVLALCDLAGNPAADFDTVLSVYDACGGTEIACNDDYCAFMSALAFSATAGSTYMVNVGGWSTGEVGTGALSVVSTLGSPFCVGDGNGTPCPCGNNAPASFLPTGCVNSAASAGTLIAGGSASLSADSVILVAAGVVPSLPGVFFSGTNAINGGLGVQFGDGLRCAGQNAVRIQVTGSDANGNAISTVEVSTNGQAYGNTLSAGDVVNYQYWYRDLPGGLCGNSHNLTNALQVVWDA